ncbi:hypothetical protein Tco_1554343 [Tanacetum coccineum]
MESRHSVPDDVNGKIQVGLNRENGRIIWEVGFIRFAENWLARWFREKIDTALVYRYLIYKQHRQQMARSEEHTVGTDTWDAVRSAWCAGIDPMGKRKDSNLYRVAYLRVQRQGSLVGITWAKLTDPRGASSLESLSKYKRHAHVYRGIFNFFLPLIEL